MSRLDSENYEEVPRDRFRDTQITNFGWSSFEGDEVSRINEIDASVAIRDHNFGEKW